MIHSLVLHRSKAYQPRVFCKPVVELLFVVRVRDDVCDIRELVSFGALHDLNIADDGKPWEQFI
ncbi:hypothetical protein CY34DRAFT_806839 [Suillus luteus UH-Slu-Lm8-n1]|uniref:Uncharacterized protein n=1 Tax=Suillus luteus UH-Slu-Lm8-n1 TaxID=930992 RepID=A0A0D0ARY4_9AGAM|nr:hypothetical protein CY34DRAFT_806839 [Suillus luteus UH-Slu-Lm8-n1]